MAPASELERLATRRGLLALGLPLAISLGLGFFLHYVNRTFLSWHSPDALAAGLPAGMLAWTVQSFFIMAAGYLGTFAAQHLGAGEHDECGAMVWPMVWLSAAAGAVTLALVPARHLLAALFGAEPVVAEGIAHLLGWYLAETGLVVLAGGISGFAGGIGRTGLVMGMAAVGCAVSIALNHWLIFGGLGVPALGIAGAGLATVGTAGAMAAAWAAWLWGPAVRARFGTWRNRNADPARIRRFCRYALPKGATEVLEMVSFLAFFAAVTRLGSRELAAANLAFSTYLMALVPVIGFCSGVSLAVGRTLGAGRPDLARKAVRSGLTLLLPVLLLIAAPFMLVPDLLLAPAVRIDPADPAADAAAWDRILDLARPVMVCLAFLAVADGMQFLWRFAIQGAGDTRWPLIVLVLTAAFGLALPTWVLVVGFSESLGRERTLVWCYGIMAAYTALVAVLMAWRYRSGPWARMSVREG
jgi:MATE family multidrug resistance protein